MATSLSSVSSSSAFVKVKSSPLTHQDRLRKTQIACSCDVFSDQSRSGKTGIEKKSSLRMSASTSSSSNVVVNVALIEKDEKKEIKKSKESHIIVIDNYDSFTYNLCQYLGDLGASFEVYRNDDLTVEEIKKMDPDGILISPGPGAPCESGISLQTVFELGPKIPLFGVCMGLQCIGEAFGGKIVRSPFGVMHGKASLVYYDEKGEKGIFHGLSNPFTACRYHSLVIEEKSFPHNELEITAWTDDGLVMGVRHKKYNHIQGVQFHPESIITSEGKMIVQNFLELVEKNKHSRMLAC